ncbi:flagellar hook-basal body protein [Bacillus sp. PS06]|uniref:flagellar hook-basal body protein n=1 Tax=Bacillus sp. PS06 TaxID=2764176 RepID=UPI00177ED741|nr:flagellar hook-basal body protein [Bacillus sp. PS06]MBD8069458.1 flagellar hook-basal body protein [Bacillus sp. PS06]
MNRSMITATNTMTQLQKQLDNIGHNLANINTNGYKKRDVQFSELLFQQFNNNQSQADAVGRLTPAGIRQGVGAKLGQTSLNLTQGSIQQTDRPLDLAFTKEGQFLQVLVEDNGIQVPSLTRDGALYLSPLNNGTNQVSLVTSEGHPVLDSDGELIVFLDQFKDLTISTDGRITVTGQDGQTQNFELSVVQVNKPQLLEAKGNNLFGLPNFAALGLEENEVMMQLVGQARAEIGITQGALEQSNVDMASEMSELMLTQRSYQFNAKSISLADQMMGLVNGIR